MAKFRATFTTEQRKEMSVAGSLNHAFNATFEVI
jgi:hypothetical protein